MTFSIAKKSKIDWKPPEFLCDKSISRHIEPPLPSSHHFMVICGPAGSGKTSLMLSMLTSKQMYCRAFHHVHLIMPEHSRGSIKNSPFDNHDKNHDELDWPTLEKIKGAVEAASKKKQYSLIIMDDVGAALKDKEIQRQLKQLIWNRRHLRTSIWIMAQSFNSMPMPIRKSISHLAMYKPNNAKEARLLFDELVYMEKEDAAQLMDFVFEHRHDFLFVDIAGGKFYKNFDLIKQRGHDANEEEEGG
jgi:hypothetical protein